MNNASIRKRAQRQRDKAKGIKELRLRLEPDEWEMLQRNLLMRRPLSTPYDATEFISLLIRRADAELTKVLKQRCNKCGDLAPSDLNGCVCRGDSKCWQTYGLKSLLITPM